jgi:hypothetical protein
MTQWQNDKTTKWQNAEIAYHQNDKMGKMLYDFKRHGQFQKCKQFLKFKI